MNIDELGKISRSIPDLTEARINELRRASRSISDLVIGREKEMRELFASADRFSKTFRGALESQFREAMKASEVLREMEGHLPVQKFENLLPDLLMSGSPWGMAERGLADISRIQDEVAKAMRAPEAARLQDLSRIQDEITREAARASESLREVAKNLPDISITPDEISRVLEGLEAPAFYEPEPPSSSLEVQEAPRDELAEQISQDLAAIRAAILRHTERWWIELVLIALLTLVANIVAPLLLEKWGSLEEPPKESILRQVDDAE